VTELPTATSGRSAERVARDCAGEATRILLDRFSGRAGGQRGDVRRKGRGNFVTETDLAVESAVLERLRAEFPEHAVLSEEGAGKSSDPKRGWLWVVDPLDGTHNYSQGNPVFSFTIALCHDGEPVLGLTCAPATGDEFFARKGGGLLVNGEPACVSATPSLAESVLGLDLGYDDERAAKLISLVAGVWPGMQAVRVMGSAALGLAFAACGRFDVYVHHFLYPWDAAAGILLVQEGGGLVLDRDGGPMTLYNDSVIAGAPGAVQDFLRVARGRAWR
jgi:fructose-1,6-bisphosphatase/inositol monophosphatase family enzyme